MRKFNLVCRRIVSGGAVVTSLLFASAASAADETSSDTAESADMAAKLNEEGAALFKAHDYRHAAEKFIRAYAIDPDPNLLFNIARCYEMLGDSHGAIEKYEEFMANPGADPRGKERAEAAVKNLRRPKSETSAPEEEADVGLAQSPSATQPPPEPEKPGTKLGVLPWVTLGAGVVVSAVGGTFYVLGDRDHTKVTDSEGFGDSTSVNPMTRKMAQALVDSGDRKKLMGGVSMAAGGALLATSVILFLVDSPIQKESSDPNMAFGVVPTVGGGAVSFQGSF